MRTTAENKALCDLYADNIRKAGGSVNVEQTTEKLYHLTYNKVSLGNYIINDLRAVLYALWHLQLSTQ